MSKIGWLHHLVQIAHYDKNKENMEELEDYLSECKFSKPKFAAEQFLTAFKDIEDKAAKVGITAKKGE